MPIGGPMTYSLFISLSSNGTFGALLKTNGFLLYILLPDWGPKIFGCRFLFKCNFPLWEFKKNDRPNYITYDLEYMLARLISARFWEFAMGIFLSRHIRFFNCSSKFFVWFEIWDKGRPWGVAWLLWAKFWGWYGSPSGLLTGCSSLRESSNSIICFVVLLLSGTVDTRCRSWASTCTWASNVTSLGLRASCARFFSIRARKRTLRAASDCILWLIREGFRE